MRVARCLRAMTRIAKLPAESGALVVKAVEKMVDQKRTDQRTKGENVRDEEEEASSKEKSVQVNAGLDESDFENVSRETFEPYNIQPEYGTNSAMS